MTKFLILMTTFLALSVSASAQSFIAGGFETGGNRVEFKDNSVIANRLFTAGTQIDKYAFYGGFVEGQYTRNLGEYASLSGRALAELTTDPKNLGMKRDGLRYHVRPEIELSVRAFREFAITAHGGFGFTRISNSQYEKNGLNPHVGLGLNYDKRYSVSFAKIFKDPTNYNDNETHGYRYRADALVPFSDKWGARLGFEYTRYSSQIPGVLDNRSPFPCACLRTDGNAFTFRVGVARIFNK